MEGQKKYQNIAGHVVGVIKLDPKNEPKAVPLDPQETVWLTPVEEQYTAEAPRDPKDNPFTNGDLAQVDSERPTPASTERSTEASETVQEESPPVASEPPEPEEQTAQVLSGPAPAETAAAPGAVEPGHDTPAPGGGSRAELHPADEEPKADEDAVEEETAVKTDEATADTAETGAAIEPQGDAPEGEYAAAEEVGTPDAPSKGKGDKKAGKKK